MKNSKLYKDLVSIIFSNIIILLSGVLVSIVIPKIMGVQQYGYYRYFTLYVGYTALMHFGFIDGVLLKFAGTDYENLNKEEFRMYSRFFFYFQSTITSLLIIAALFTDNLMKIIVILIAVDMLANNLTSYFQFISQAIMFFNQLSKRNIIQASLKILVIIVLIFLMKIHLIDDVSAKLYILLVVLIDVMLSIWYINTYKQLIWGKKAKFNYKNIVSLILSGMPLTVAYQISNIISSLDRQFIAIFYSVTIYGLYSFSYSLLSLINPVTNAISMVLLPNLKKKNKEKIFDNFTQNMTIVEVISCFAMLGYYPLKIFVSFFLPNYFGSIEYLRILFPSLILTSCINIILLTYYKAIDKVKIYFLICIEILIITFIANVLAYKFFNSAHAIAVTSVITTFLWFFQSQHFFVKKFKINHIKNDMYMYIMTLSFYVSTFLFDNFIATFIYLLGFIGLTTIFFKNLI